MGELDGKRIIVTGASRGLGRAYATALAGEGARLIVNGTNEALVEGLLSEIRGKGGTASAVIGSVADDKTAEQMVTASVEEYGGVDVVINNAGTVRDRTLLKMTPEEFDEVVAVNLRGTWSVSRHAASAMQGSGGLLLQVISASAFTSSVGQTNYAAAKAGVMGMLYAWDAELKRYGIRVNALWPIAQTDMSQVVIDNAAARAAANEQPAPSPAQLGFGSPAEVASLVVYLCSDRASQLRSQLVTFNGSKLALWSHPRETWIRRQPSWTLDELDEALRDAAEPVYQIEF